MGRGRSPAAPRWLDNCGLLYLWLIWFTGFVVLNCLVCRMNFGNCLKRPTRKCDIFRGENVCYLSLMIFRFLPKDLEVGFDISSSSKPGN